MKPIGWPTATGFPSIRRCRPETIAQAMQCMTWCKKTRGGAAGGSHDRSSTDYQTAVRCRGCGGHAAGRAHDVSLCQPRLERHAVPGNRSGRQRDRRLRNFGHRRLAPRLAARRIPDPNRNVERYCASPLLGVAGSGISGRCEVAPEPVVLGGFMPLVLPVVAGAEPLLAVLLLPFRPAITRNAINATTAMPAIQPHVPPTGSSRRSTGSLKRGSV